jgi:hypothetical protein
MEDMMKKILIILLVFVLALMSVSSAFAAGPCDDTDGDGSPSGFEYAQYHIVEAALAGVLGLGHKPGVVHQGFSTCNPSGL